MNYKILTNSDGVVLIEHVIRQGLLNNGFDTKEELLEMFPDSALNVTYVNIDTIPEIYAIKNIKTNELIYNKDIMIPNKYYEKLNDAKLALDGYRKFYESKVKYIDFTDPFLKANPPEDLELVTFYLVGKNTESLFIDNKGEESNE